MYKFGDLRQNRYRIQYSRTKEESPEAYRGSADAYTVICQIFACVPRKDERIRLIINVEAQKDCHPGYQIPTRGVFYGARMISSQLGTEFSDSSYDGIKKVYSIWVCLGVPDYIGNAIAEYHMVKRDILPGFPDVKRIV